MEKRALRTPLDAEVRALLARHGLPDAEPTLAERQGDVNLTYFAGEVVVRIARKEKNDAIQDWRTEILAHPYVHAADVRTPRLLAWGEHYTILERIEGRNMDASAPEAFFRSLGAQLARLHDLPAPNDPEGVLDDLTGEAPIDLAHVPDLLLRLAERVAPYASVPGGTFVHGDVMPGNVLVGPDGEAWLIDWGDAGNGHPAYDFCAVPLVGLPFALEAYAPTDADFRRRLVALRLEIAAYRNGRGDPEWMDEALAHRDLLEGLAA